MEVGSWMEERSEVDSRVRCDPVFVFAGRAPSVTVFLKPQRDKGAKHFSITRTLTRRPVGRIHSPSFTPGLHGIVESVRLPFQKKLCILTFKWVVCSGLVRAGESQSDGRLPVGVV